MTGCTQEQRTRNSFLRPDFNVFPKHSQERRTLNDIEHANDTVQMYRDNPYAKKHFEGEVDGELRRLEQIYAEAKPEAWAAHLQELEEAAEYKAAELVRQAEEYIEEIKCETAKESKEKI